MLYKLFAWGPQSLLFCGGDRIIERATQRPETNYFRTTVQRLETEGETKTTFGYRGQVPRRGYTRTSQLRSSFGRSRT